jgi:hypothetical protein
MFSHDLILFLNLCGSQQITVVFLTGGSQLITVVYLTGGSQLITVFTSQVTVS